jgi:hypothetical protein
MRRGFLFLENYLLQRKSKRRWFKMNPRKRRLLKLRTAEPAAPAPEPVVEAAPPAPEPVAKEAKPDKKAKPKARRTAKKTKSSEG